MSSSSSDSDSDEFEPIRRIKINIRPKGHELGAKTADVSEIKASVEAWRPLGPPPHSSLSRRQSSLSSVSSMSFGAGGSSGANSNTSTQMSSSQQTRASTANGGGGGGVFGGSIYSSPSCSSLVNEFNNRSSFSNFMSTTSRTSSPLTLVNYGDVVPIAIAIQESIELVVNDHYDPSAIEPKFNSRILGNIKVAFSNAFAKGVYNQTQPTLKICMHSTDKIIRYYASRLIKDLDLSTVDSRGNNPKPPDGSADSSSIRTITSIRDQDNLFLDLMETKPYPTATQSNSKLIEFDMDALINTLRRMYDRSPTSKYYNVDVLRYQVSPLNSIRESPLQVCAYWKVESKVVKLRIDFKHSDKSGLNLERLREITFTVNFKNFIPCNIDVNSLSPDSVSTLRLNNNNNNNSAAMNMNNLDTRKEARDLLQRGSSVMNDEIVCNNLMAGFGQNHLQTVSIPPPPLVPAPRHSLSRRANRIVDAFGTPSVQTTSDSGPFVSDFLPANSSNTKVVENNAFSSGHQSAPIITHEPQAQWNSITKQLTWKFDTLLAYRKSDGLGSLFAKLDFRNHLSVPSQLLENQKPSPVDVKFLVIDSTLSKVNLSIDSTGYKMSLLKREIRSGKYLSEPYLM